MSRREPPQAVPTYFDGTWFRSRLEARWAVFFKTLGVPYRYEPEGHDLERAGFYIPDFELEAKPNGIIYAEVKAKALAGIEMMDKLISLVEAENGLALSLEGIPGHATARAFGGGVGLMGVPGVFMDCRRCEGVWFVCKNGTQLAIRCTCGDGFRQPASDERCREAAEIACAFSFQNPPEPSELAEAVL